MMVRWSAKGITLAADERERPTNGSGKQGEMLLQDERCASHTREREAKGCALATGGSGASHRGDLNTRGVALTRAGVVLARSPACLAMTFAFSQRVALRAGEGGCCLGLPPHGAPPSNPRRHPRRLPDVTSRESFRADSILTPPKAKTARLGNSQFCSFLTAATPKPRFREERG